MPGGRDYPQHGNEKIRSLIWCFIIGSKKVLQTTSAQQDPEILLLPPCTLLANVKFIFLKIIPLNCKEALSLNCFKSVVVVGCLGGSVG